MAALKETTTLDAENSRHPQRVSIWAKDNVDGTLRPVLVDADGNFVIQLEAGAVSIGTVVLGAGSAIAGKFGIDQTTPGTTNAMERVPSGVAGAGIAPVVTAALATSKVIKASAGNLYGFNGMATTVPGIFLVHNSASAPAAGAVTPIKAYPVAAGQAVADKFDPPIRCGAGISITFTSAATPFTQTDSATAFIEGDAV